MQVSPLIKATVVLGAGLAGLAPDNHPHYTCRAAISSLGSAPVAEHDIEVEDQRKIVAIVCESGVWRLTCHDSRVFQAQRLVVTSPPPKAVFLQRWRYAMPTLAADGEPWCRLDVPAPLMLAGESFTGRKIEGAWLSGRTSRKSLL